CEAQALSSARGFDHRLCENVSSKEVWTWEAIRRDLNLMSPCALCGHGRIAPVVQILLPANSRIRQGRTWNEPEGSGRWIALRIYRWNGEAGQLPSLDTYWINQDRCGPMVLDA